MLFVFFVLFNNVFFYNVTGYPHTHITTCSSSRGRRTKDRTKDFGRRTTWQKDEAKEIIKDERQNIVRKDECSGREDLLNSCKLNLLKDSKTSGEDLTGKLTNSQDEIFTKKTINQNFMIFNTKSETIYCDQTCLFPLSFCPLSFPPKNADL